MFKINGIELEMNLFDVEEKEFFNECFKNANEKIQQATKEIKDGEPDTVFMRKYCQAIIDFIDEFFGEGTANDIFEGRTDMKKCALAIQEIVKEKIRQDKEFAEINKQATSLIFDFEQSSSNEFEKFSPNRAQRRLAAKHKN